MTFERVREVLYSVRDEFGRAEAVRIIREIGKAELIAEISGHLYKDVIRHAEALLYPYPDDDQTADRLQRAAGLLILKRNALEQLKEQMMAAIDDLKTAVNGAVTEMGRAADFIRAHPAVQNDPQLADMATRLKAAATALGGVDVEAVVTPPAP